MGAKMAGSQALAGPLVLGVPLAVWVAVTVALLSAVATLISVWRADRSSRRNLEAQLAAGAAQLAKQLAHDAEQRDRERAMSLRREIYLEVAGALENAGHALGRVTDIGHDLQAVYADFAAASARLAKVQMVGSDKTVEAVMTYVNEMGPAFIELLMRRVPIAIRKQMIDGETDPAKKAQLRHEQMKAKLEAAERTIALALKTTKLVPNAVLAVRDEMELPLDKGRYLGLWEVQLNRMDEVWIRAKRELEQLSASPAPQ
jgi:hypothetical protein